MNTWACSATHEQTSKGFDNWKHMHIMIPANRYSTLEF